jgi:ribosome-binding protein aMBF1 (putative translation factor)
MSSLTERIDSTRLAAGMSIQDVARFLNVPYPTARCWCRHETEPADHSIRLIEERLGWLDHALSQEKLPVPLGHRPAERKKLIETLRSSYESNKHKRLS